MIQKKKTGPNLSSFLILMFSILLVSALQANSTVKVSINSGNPVFPFPQFQPYKNSSGILENNGTKPGVGVTHAEMEQTIRDAYQIMMNRAFKPGGAVDGVDYIKFNSDCDCTEGDGYALLAAVAMADKETFDGLWLWIHDFRMNKVKRYSDCKDASPGYNYSRLPGYKGSNTNTATDGDVDIGFALFMAYLQWGEFMGIKDACGEMISYKKETIEYLKAFTDTLVYALNGIKYVSGDVGFDGYLKSGDSWGELTNWANDKMRSGFSVVPEAQGPQETYFDYSAPSYFHAFADFLEKEDASKYAWNIKQFRRVEASCDWLMGQLLEEDDNIPFRGKVQMTTDGKPTFSDYSDGEDFRLAWRTIMNYVWHGNPSTSWDPISHQVKNSGNTYEMNMGKRYANFLWDKRQQPWNKPCMANAGGDKNTTYWGIETLKFWYDNKGELLKGNVFPINWVPSTGSPSAIVAQDFKLIPELYRSLEIKWDSDSGGKYLTSYPHYFHGWFRVFGLLLLSGNYQSPSEIKPTANTKVYLDINKTFAFEGDTVTYTIDYRNFGSLDAQDVKIIDTLHKDFIYISSTGGGTFNAASNTVTWNIEKLSGFKTATGIDPSKGQVKLVVKIGSANQKQYRNKVSISCSNGSGWTSNEYPNNINSVMERNYLDIAKRALVIKKTASNTMVNPEKEIQFTIDFENTSEAGWINGGRSGVHFSFSHSALPSDSKSAECTMRFRLFHDANEAYIDYGNYRISYYLFDAGLQCYKDKDGCTSGWEVKPSIVEGIDRNYIKLLQENVSPGDDGNGKKWNQRIIVQFSDPTDPDRTINLTTTNFHLDWYAGSPAYIHRGGTMPLRLVWILNSNPWTDVIWDDDWSWDPKAIDTDGGKYWPVTNDWTDPDNPDVPVDRWGPKECSAASHTVNNVLIEEWDGYTWRRVAGDGPLPGREVSNVKLYDTIPAGFTFSKFIGEAPLGVSATVNGNIITWTIPKLQIKQKGSLKYIAIASGSCPMQNKKIMTRAWISADKESPIYDSVAVTVTCDSVPPPPPPQTTMYKVSDKPVYQKNDTVTYKIAYKQTHGTIVNKASDINDWIDKAGKGKFTISSDTIIYDKINAMMVYKYSYGTNGTFGGTFFPPYYTFFSLIARNSGNDYVEIKMKKDFGDMLVQFYNSGKQVGNDQRFSYKNFNGNPPLFDFKVRLSGDTISLWAGDTSALSPSVTQTGIDIRAGYAGVKSLVNDVGIAKIVNWSSHLDATFDMSIHDKLPSNLSFKSAGGSVITGAQKGKQLTATYENGDIKWPVVSGETVLDPNDSLQLWVKATLNDCTGDTICNTAYANIRGYPNDYIGAQSKITCSSGQQSHHVDIILDTTAFSRTNDEYVEPIELGSNQKTFTLFAVVRDINGNFIKYADSAVWNSSNLQVANVNSGASRWIGEITNIGSGKTIIRVSQPGILGDSIEVTISASASWPVIKSATMLDTNGDITPDMMIIILTDDFADGQKCDSVTINYNGKTYSIPSSSISKQNEKLSVPFTSLTGTDSRPSGKVSIHLTVDGNQKQNTKSFVDGVGPALISASILEPNGDEADILFLAFSEPVLPSTLIGKQLLLIKENTSDTIELTIDKINSFLSDTAISVQLIKSAKRPAAGDALRLMPGSKGGTISDLNFNLPHNLNRSVIITIKKGPAKVNSAFYFDKDANGFLDYVKVRFKRAVNRNEIDNIKIQWYIDPNKVETITADSLEQLNDSTIRIPIHGKIIYPDTVTTNPGMDLKITYKEFSDLPVTSLVKDSAAIVAVSAQILPGVLLSNGTRQYDTLVVILSEKVNGSFGTEPFIFLHKKENNQFILKLNHLDSKDTAYRFLIDKDNFESVIKGDTLWINPETNLKDVREVAQSYSFNRRVSIDVIWPPSEWKVIAGPNPFTPNKTEISSEIPKEITKCEYCIAIKASPKNPVDMDDIKVNCTIYDIMGNIVYSQEMKKYGSSFYGAWNGYNKKNRLVGTGTYCAYIWITENSGKKLEKVKIGVKR